ncbi:hypothetical protein EST38_g10099 [Candolleomyces aberdarensis]|uniref:Uncharacterized protein n=1 Tax=Candolleomyces aberdarensis TaxID=2316362 RepID=A0A4Q2DBI4_9AGAR|nr:hypothetical protein EST38_g10099 [Candolleomyces aberdarensis]
MPKNTFSDAEKRLDPIDMLIPVPFEDNGGATTNTTTATTGSTTEGKPPPKKPPPLIHSLSPYATKPLPPTN